MRLVTLSALLCLTTIAATSAARADDDAIINGLHCNSLCQAWLGVQSRPAAEPPVVVASRPPPLPTEPEVYGQARPQPLPIKRASRLSPRLVPMATISKDRSEAVLTASREATPRAALPNPPLTPEAPATRAKLPQRLQPLAALEPAPSSVPLRPIPSQSEDHRLSPSPSLVRHEPATQQALPSQDEASFEPDTQEPMRAQKNAQHGVSRRPIRQSTLADTNERMEPGLKTLPKLSDIVAVRGSIIVDTPEDRAIAQKQLAEMVKATTRPKQFRTGFIDQPSPEHDAGGKSLSDAR